jgi:hypothetical protein
MTTAYGYMPFLTKEKQPDGTLLVTGVASDSSLDRDYQIADPEWLRKAAPKWFAESGNIREQHDPHKAAGVAVGYHENDQGQHIVTAKIVDPVTVSKIEHGVLKGYSFGARNARVTTDKAAAAGRIVAGDWSELSVVDRPSNRNSAMEVVLAKADNNGELQLLEEPELVEKTIQIGEDRFTPADLAAMLDKRAKPAEPTTVPAATDKADQDDTEPAMFGDGLEKAVSADQRKEDAKSGVAMPNGDFPIPDEGHLKSAVGHFGNYKGDKGAARKHIVKRARALKLTNLLPDDWGITKALELAEEFGLVADLHKLDGDNPATEVGDIAGAKQALATIARLIVSEANDLAAGNLGELGDISTLVEAGCALKWFIQSEAAEVGKRTPASDDVATAVAAAGMDVVMAGKTDASAATKDSPATDAGVIEKSTTDSTTSTEDGTTEHTLTDAITKALQPLQDELALVKAELAQVKDTPQSGGPVRTKADQLRREVAHCEQGAASTGGPVQEGYRQRLAAAEAELQKLDGAA